MTIAVDHAKSNWRELPERARLGIVLGIELAIAIALLLWVRSLGWGFAYVVATLWALRIRDDRIRWGLEAAIAILTLIFLRPLGVISVLIFGLAELPQRYRRWASARTLMRALPSTRRAAPAGGRRGSGSGSRRSATASSSIPACATRGPR